MDLIPLEPWRCEEVSLTEFEKESLKLVHLLDHLSMSFGRGNEDGERDESEVRGWQDFRESILPGDALWLMTEPPSHPEVSQGSACLLLLRNHQIVTRFQLYLPVMT